MENEIVLSALILDDEIRVVDHLKAALTERGFVTWTTKDQVEAIRFVQNHKPSVACIDLHMPGMNGIEVIKKMREIIPSIRVVVVTGYADMYHDELAVLKVRVVEKTSRTIQELETAICEELELSKIELELLQKREKPAVAARILIVDDYEDNADFLRDLVREEGFEAEAAHSAEEAIQKLETFKADILFSDLEMPKMHGDELIKKLRSSGNSSIKLYIGMTGHNDPQMQNLFIEAGAKEVLRKPFDATTLVNSLKRWTESIKA